MVILNAVKTDVQCCCIIATGILPRYYRQVGTLGIVGGNNYMIMARDNISL